MNENMNWIQIKDGNINAFNLFTRHYSFNSDSKRIGKNAKRFCAPGERIVLVTENYDALLVWSRQKFRADNQNGVNCSIFRNESEILSSTLIREAVEIALQRWKDSRLFTFVNPVKVKSSNPGYCFKMAGFKVCGKTKKRNYLILEFNSPR